MEVLARVDLLCEQLEDCRVKVDSMTSLLVAHSPQLQHIEALTPKFSKLTISKSKPKVKHRVCEPFIDRVMDDKEKMRAGNISSDYNIEAVTINPALMVVGPEQRITQLASAHLIASPSQKYRDDCTLVRFESCPSGLVECITCTTPSVQRLWISTAVLQALVHAHTGHFKAAHTCLNEVSVMNI